MTLDVRDVLEDLAAGAPPVDLADVAIAGARRRRRFALVGGATAAAVIVVMALALPSAVTLDASPASPSGGAPRYDPTIGTPWPYLRHLPDHLDEPVALTYTLNTGDRLPSRLVTASGRQWDITGLGEDTPSISDDGWHVAFYDHATDNFVLHNLHTGASRSFPYGYTSAGTHEQLSLQTPMPWSPDGRRVALAAYDPGRDGFHIVVLDSDTGSVTDLQLEGFVTGWLDNSTLLVVDWTVDEPARLLAVDLSGAQHVLSTTTFPADVGINAYVLSPDGTTLAAVVDSGGSTTVESVDVATGRASSVSCVDCQSEMAPSWVSDTEVLARGPYPDGGVQRFLALDVRTGATRTLVTFSPRFGEVSDLGLAVGVISAGADGHAYTAKYWPGWYADYIIYGVALVIAAIALRWWLVRRRRLRTWASQIERLDRTREGAV